MPDASMCKQAAELYEAWCTTACALEAAGLTREQLSEHEDYQVKYKAYRAHRETCPTCRRLIINMFKWANLAEPFEGGK